MRSTQGIWLCLGLAVLVGSCKSSDFAGGLKDALSGRPKILLIGAGGWKSCGDGLNPVTQRIVSSIQNLEEDLRKHADVNILLVCANLISPAVPTANMGIFDQFSRSAFGVKSRDIPAVVSERMAAFRPTQVYFIGHSYGGWVVFNLAEAGISSNAIFALDPIDASICRPDDNLLSGFGVGSQDCQVSPMMNLTSAKRVFSLWQRLGPIHSSPLRGSNVENVEMDVNHSVYAGDDAKKAEGAHRMIGSYPPAWGMICDAIFRANGWDPKECKTIDTDAAGKRTQIVTAEFTPLRNTDFVSDPRPSPNDPLSDNRPFPQNDDVIPKPNDQGFNNGGGNSLCGNPTERTAVCITSDFREITVKNIALNPISCQVSNSGASQLFPGATAFYCVMNLSQLNVRGRLLNARQQVAFLVRDYGNGKVQGFFVIQNAFGQWEPFGSSTDAFALQRS